MWPAVKQGFSQEGFRKYVHDLPASKWHPQMIVWHNTAAPDLEQWEKVAAQDKSKGIIPGTTRIGNLENFFRFDNNWSGCPHLFTAEDLIWVMNPLIAPGVHSPSWNGISFGIEMVGDFATDDPDSGPGLQVKLNTIYATAVLCEAYGISPQTIMLHKQDPKTTHDCPGKKMALDKFAMIQSVEDLMAGGEHLAVPTSTPASRAGFVATDNLNFRVGPSAMSESKGMLHRGTVVEILGEAANSTAKWLKVKTPTGYIGWVAGKYIEEK